MRPFHAGRAAALAVVLLSLAFALAAPTVRADATSDALNSTVALVTNLMLALIPLFIIVGVFGLILGMFAGRRGVFRKLERF